MLTLRSTRLLVVGLAACVGLVAGGCSNPETPLSTEIEFEPLGAFAERSVQDERLLRAAEDKLFRDCMSALGFQIPTFPDPAMVERTSPFDLPSRAAELGYLGEDAHPVENLQTWIVEQDQEDIDRFFLAAFGPPPDGEPTVIDLTDPGDVRDDLPERGGCNGQAEQEVQPASNAYESTRLQLQAAYNNAAAEALQHSEVQAAVERWSTCMSGAGMSYGTPNDAIVDNVDRPLPEQLPVVRADQDCRARSEYPAIAQRAFWGLQQEWADANPGVLTEYATLRQSALENARQVLGVTESP